MSYWWMILYSRPTVVLNRSTHSWLPVNGCRDEQPHNQLPNTLKAKVRAQSIRLDICCRGLVLPPFQAHKGE